MSVELSRKAKFLAAKARLPKAIDPGNLRGEPRNLRTLQLDVPSASLGRLEHLPLEVLHLILPDLHFCHLENFSLVNKRARQVVESMLHYDELVFHGRDIIRALKQTGLIRQSSYTFRRLWDLMTEGVCESSKPNCCCATVGLFIFLPLATRYCHYCLLNGREILSGLITKEQAEFLMYNVPRNADRHPLITYLSIPGTYEAAFSGKLYSIPERFALTSTRNIGAIALATVKDRIERDAVEHTKDSPEEEMDDALMPKHPDRLRSWEFLIMARLRRLGSRVNAFENVNDGDQDTYGTNNAVSESNDISVQGFNRPEDDRTIGDVMKRAERAIGRNFLLSPKTLVLMSAMKQLPLTTATPSLTSSAWQPERYVECRGCEYERFLKVYKRGSTERPRVLAFQEGTTGHLRTVAEFLKHVDSCVSGEQLWHMQQGGHLDETAVKVINRSEDYPYGEQ